MFNPPVKATPASVRAALAAAAVRPSRKLGQNFLVDQNILDRIINHAGPLNLPVLEVGPGLGQLTGALLAAGYEVHAVEFDHRLAAHLRHAFPSSNFHLTEADAVDQPLGTVPSETPFQVIANLPYAITSPWLEQILLKPEPLPCSLTLLIQLEAWQRLSAHEGSKARSAIAVLFTVHYEPTWTHRVAPACFYPPPEVDSILVQVHLRPHRHRFSPATIRILRELFQQRRKQIGKRLATLTTPEIADHWFSTDPVATPQSRPESIPNASWIHLDQTLHPPRPTA